MRGMNVEYKYWLVNTWNSKWIIESEWSGNIFQKEMTICAIKFPKCSLHGRTPHPPPLIGLPLFIKRTGNTCENGQNPDTDNTKCWWGCGAAGTLVFAGGGAKWLSHCPNFRRQFGSSYKIKHLLLFKQSSPTLCNSMDCSMPGFSVPHCLLESAQTHVHWVKWCHLTISSSEIKHPLTTWSSSCASCYTPKGDKKFMSTQKSAHGCFYQLSSQLLKLGSNQNVLQ